MSIRIGDIPEYAEAVRQEGLVRDAAFLSLNEDVAGFELRPMSLLDYLILCIANNPLLVGEEPSDLQLIAFLWLLSPEYSPTNARKRKSFSRRCQKLFGPPERPLFPTRFFLRRWLREWAKRQVYRKSLIEVIRKYVEETFQDRPSRRAGSGQQKDYYSQAASICGQMMCNFFQAEEQVLRMPLKRVFQYLKVFHAMQGRSEFLFNPSDGILNRWAMEQQAKKQ